MINQKLSEGDCKRIIKLINEGHQIKDIAKRFGVDRTTIYHRCKGRYKSRLIPVEIKNKVIKAIQDGYTKAEAAQLYSLNIGTVISFTNGMKGYKYQGSHIIRKNGIKLLNRLMNDGCLITDFNAPIVRNLQRKFPIIRSARYKNKTFFYLPGREEQTIEAYCREKPDKIINYSAIEEMSCLLGVKISNRDQYKLIERFKKKHDTYWKSRQLVQLSLDNWSDEPQPSEISFRMFPKREE